MHVTAIIQARTGSRRLPGKILKDVCGKPVIMRVIERVQAAETVDEVVLAAPKSDMEALSPIVNRSGARAYWGEESDVLKRFSSVIQSISAYGDAVVRICGDSPLVMPECIDQVVGALDDGVDYVCNYEPRTYPAGLDVSAFHVDVLARISRMATSRYDRQHVRTFIHEHRHLFRMRNVEDYQPNASLKWCVDTEYDYQHVCNLFRWMLQNGGASYQDLIRHARRIEPAPTGEELEVMSYDS